MNDTTGCNPSIPNANSWLANLLCCPSNVGGNLPGKQMNVQQPAAGFVGSNGVQQASFNAKQSNFMTQTMQAFPQFVNQQQPMPPQTSFPQVQGSQSGTMLQVQGSQPGTMMQIQGSQPGTTMQPSANAASSALAQTLLNQLMLSLANNGNSANNAPPTQVPGATSNNPPLTQVAGVTTSNVFSMNNQEAPVTCQIADPVDAADGTQNPDPSLAPPPTRRFPCRARGMPLDHNAKTAFYDVSEVVSHGKDLTCSHELCQAQGGKFQFCIYCNRPVAKRNFRNRHMHIDQAYPETSIVSGSSKKRNALSLASPSLDAHVAKTAKMTTEGGILRKDAYTVVTHDISTASSSNGFSRLSNQENVNTEGPVPSNTNTYRLLKTESMASAICDSAANSQGQESAESDSKRETKWVALLGLRPPDGNIESTAAWLDSVLQLSDGQIKRERISFREIAIEYLKSEGLY